MLRKREILFPQSENSRLDFRNGSLFHGYLMEKVSEDFANKMHISSLRPFSQYLAFSRQENCWKWTITTLNEEADHVMEPIIADIKKIEIKKKNWEVPVGHIRNYSPISYKELTEQCYCNAPSRLVDIEFVTPCSFRVAGNNIILPDIRLFYQNIINRWNGFAETISIKDPDAMDHIIQHTSIRDFNIRSRAFSLESVRIKGVEGKMSLKITGTETLASLCNLLLLFSEYSGVGSRTALGMGGIRVEFK